MVIRGRENGGEASFLGEFLFFKREVPKSTFPDEITSYNFLVFSYVFIFSNNDVCVILASSKSDIVQPVVLY